jgi:hypothetical protein
MPIIVLDPTAQSENTALHYAPLLPSLEGRRVGILDNRKANADLLLEEVERMMRSRYGVQACVHVRKSDFSRPAAPALLAELSSCDLVITGVGD